jgi:hypothetical protein
MPGKRGGARLAVGLVQGWRRGGEAQGPGGGGGGGGGGGRAVSRSGAIMPLRSVGAISRRISR